MSTQPCSTLFRDWFAKSPWAGAGKDAGQLAEAAWSAGVIAAADIFWHHEITLKRIAIKDSQDLMAAIKWIANTSNDTITVTREAILQELRRRWKEDRGSGVTAPADISRFHQPQTNYFCGQGSMECPVCKTGKLQYLRSNSNGHVHARCSTAGCVAWDE